jgi:CheY-like chemotaxis protein
MPVSALPRESYFIIADDDPDDHEFVKEACLSSSIKYEFDSVYDGAQLLERLVPKFSKPTAEKKPDFILLDLNMPVLDGFTVLKRLKSEKQIGEIPIFVLSTSNSQKDRDTAKELGVYGFYSKPVKLRILTEIIDEACERSFLMKNSVQRG